MKVYVLRQPLAATVLLALCLMVLLVGNCQFKRSWSAEPTPLPSAEHGRHLFTQSCAHCHGDDARGDGEDGDGPDLYRLRIGNARIAAVIRTGIPDEMPSFLKKHGPEDIADLTAYLRTLQ